MSAAARGAYRGTSFSFTESRVAAAIRSADPDDADVSGRRSWRDEGCRGLTLLVNVRTGSAAWYYVGKQGGKTARKHLGDVDVVKLEEARQTVNRIRFDGTFAALAAPRPVEDADADDEDKSPLLGVVVADMLEAHSSGRWLPGSRSKPPSDRTQKFYADLRRATLAAHEQLTLQAFAEQLPTIYAALSKRAPVQGNRFLQLVRNVYAYAADAELWTRANPAIGSGRAQRLTKAPEKPRTRILSDAEWRRLDKAMAADDQLWRDLFTMSIESLQRMAPCCNAKWDDITLTGTDASWRIPARWMKGRRSGHVIPLADMPQLLELLRARRRLVPKSCPWVFPALGGDGHVVWYKTAWKRILERSKLWSEDKEQRPRPHDLRRTGGARMTEANVPLQTVTRALGDAPSSAGMVARVYAQVSDGALRDAFAATSKRRRRR